MASPAVGHLCVIPTALDIDRRPVPGSDRSDAADVVDEPVPCLGTGVEDLVIAVPDTGGEFVGPQVVPDIVHRVQFWAVGRQGQQDDVAGQLEFAAGLMPAGTIADQRCDGTWCNLGADLSPGVRGQWAYLAGRGQPKPLI
jgi:hypothetical protein